MKSNTTMKILTLCVICAALLSGCVESDDAAGSSIDTTDGATSTAPDVVISDGSSGETVVYIDLNEFKTTDKINILRILLIPGGTGEMCGGTMRGDDCYDCTWKKISDSKYEFYSEFSETTSYITLLPDDVAEVAMFGVVYQGGWDRIGPEDTNRKPVATPTKSTPVETPRPKTTPTPVANDESGFVMEYPFLVSIIGTGVQEGVNFVVMIDDDGETGYRYTWCGMNIAAAYEIKMFDVTHNDGSITYRGNDPDGMALSITAYETERGGGRATQIGFDEESDCVWNPWDNCPKIITGKIVQYNQEWL